MIAAEVIRRKRDGGELERDELRRFLGAYMEGEVADYQMSAFLMAVFFRGLTGRELSVLTESMVASGTRLDFSGGPAPAVDKHSTGGVGDTVSLVLAPLLAEAGLRVPMMSGRGLGHTGGTLDKLESIPGFRTDLGLEEFREVLEAVGCAMIGPTEDIAPLDGRLYGLRDVTGTVESVPLIASSIVSKKVAEGIEVLVLDVKFGRGAFMPERERARELAESLVALAGQMGLEARALLTDMDFPLGRCVGNALEVREAVRCLRGGGSGDLREVTVALAAEALAAAGRSGDRAEARRRLDDLLDSGAAARRFALLVERQGGDPGVVDDPDLLPSAPVRRVMEAPGSGWVEGLDAREVGMTAVELGAGRRKMGEAVDPAVGLVIRCGRGLRVEAGAPLVEIHARDRESAGNAARRLRSALELSPEPVEPPPGRVAERVADG